MKTLILFLLFLSLVPIAEAQVPAQYGGKIDTLSTDWKSFYVGSSHSSNIWQLTNLLATTSTIQIYGVQSLADTATAGVKVPIFPGYFWAPYKPKFGVDSIFARRQRPSENALATSDVPVELYRETE